MIEACHAVVYFAPEAKERYKQAGLRGGWMGYFATRAAALGPVGPGVVTALFYGFEPAMVARAIPDAWTYCPPDQAIAARYDVADAVLRRLLGEAVDGPEIAEAAELGRAAEQAAPFEGRALYAAHAALPLPAEPHLRLFHAVTALREYRGDGHVAALLAAEVDGCASHVLATAVGRVPAEQRTFRGWSEEQWAAAADRLRARGWIGPDSTATPTGHAARADIEALTSRLAAPPFDVLGPDRTARFTELLRPLVERIIGGGGIRFPNPVGLAAPG